MSELDVNIKNVKVWYNFCDSSANFKYNINYYHIISIYYNYRLAQITFLYNDLRQLLGFMPAPPPRSVPIYVKFMYKRRMYVSMQRVFVKMKVMY